MLPITLVAATVPEEMLSIIQFNSQMSSGWRPSAHILLSGSKLPGFSSPQKGQACIKGRLPPSMIARLIVSISQFPQIASWANQGTSSTPSHKEGMMSTSLWLLWSDTRVLLVKGLPSQFPCIPLHKWGQCIPSV